MSLETWKAEFYPIPACEVRHDAFDATLHSLTKWIGLREENLKRHGCEMSGWLNVRDSREGGVFYIDDDSCALCSMYYDHRANQGHCKGCPLFEVGYGCGESSDSGWNVWDTEGDPEPMIAQLTQVLKTLEKK